MATRTVLVDDLDGTEGAKSVRFAFDGTDYEIDLTDDNAKELRSALDRFIKAGRPVRSGAQSSARRQPSASGRSTKRNDLEAVREWARANGHKVGTKGRISAKVQEAYDAANS